MASDGDVMSWYDIKPFVKIGFVVNFGMQIMYMYVGGRGYID